LKVHEEEYFEFRQHLARMILIAGLHNKAMKDEITMRPTMGYKDTIKELKKIEVTLADGKKNAPTVTEIKLAKEVAELKQSMEKMMSVDFHKKGNPKTIKKNFSGPIECFYCKKKGHMQRECNKRKRENGAYKDKDGKPFRRAREAEQEREEEAFNGPSSFDPYATTENTYNVDSYSLNWQ
jgi:Zinc knuckle